VIVGEDDRGDRVERTVDLCERLRQLVVVTGEATIDDHNRTVDVVEVPANPLGAESVDAISELLDRSHRAPLAQQRCAIHRRAAPGSGCGSERRKVRAQMVDSVSAIASASAAGLPTIWSKKQ
jgi:hypothetical protein